MRIILDFLDNKITIEDLATTIVHLKREIKSIKNSSQFKNEQLKREQVNRELEELLKEKDKLKQQIEKLNLLKNELLNEINKTKLEKEIINKTENKITPRTVKNKNKISCNIGFINDEKVTHYIQLKLDNVPHKDQKMLIKINNKEKMYKIIDVVISIDIMSHLNAINQNYMVFAEEWKGSDE